MSNVLRLKYSIEFKRKKVWRQISSYKNVKEDVRSLISSILSLASCEIAWDEERRELKHPS